MGWPLILGVDFGTQGVRTAVFDSNAHCLNMAFAGYDTYYPSPGWAEQHPEEWWNAFKKALSGCLTGLDSTEIAGMAVCATSSTVLAVDEEGRPLMPAILWMDARAIRQTEKINSTGNKVLRYSGGQVSVEWMLPKTLWIKENKPDIYESAYQILEQLDWINYRLTDRFVSSKCTATCKWNFTDTEGGWSDEFMREIGLGDFKDKIPVDVVPVGGRVGRITPETAAEIGLPKELPVFQGGIDAHIGMLGLGVVNPGQMGVIMGTSFVHLTLTQVPVYHQGLWGPYPSAVIEDLWLLEGGQVSAGSLTKWFKDQFASELPYSNPNDDPYQVLAGQAQNIPPGSEGLIVLDTWQGNRTPYRDPMARGAVWGLTLSHTRAHLYRAVLEGVAHGTRNILEAFNKAECPVTEIVACGGVLKNPVWLQIIADVTGVPIKRTKFTEAGVLGCAVAAAVGLGYFKGLGEASRAMVEFGETVKPDL
ncbi:MAG: FGGY-family carbohydrate kinase, partial [Eubacteriales bacterium]